MQQQSNRIITNYGANRVKQSLLLRDETPSSGDHKASIDSIVHHMDNAGPTATRGRDDAGFRKRLQFRRREIDDSIATHQEGASNVGVGRFTFVHEFHPSLDGSLDQLHDNVVRMVSDGKARFLWNSIGWSASWMKWSFGKEEAQKRQDTRRRRRGSCLIPQ